MAIAVAALIAPGVAAALTVELNLLYVHGIKHCTANQQTAEDSLTDRPDALPVPVFSVPLRAHLQSETGMCWESTSATRR